MARPDPAAWWRGASTALLTVALAVGAHAIAGGGPPAGGGVALLVMLAGTIGAATAHTDRARGVTGLIAALALGQVLGHLVLAAAGHTHAAAGPPGAAMVGAHAAAVVTGAVLIAAGGRFCKALSTTVRALTASPSEPSRAAVVVVITSDQPLQWTLSLRSSVSHRGPPVSTFC